MKYRSFFECCFDYITGCSYSDTAKADFPMVFILQGVHILQSVYIQIQQKQIFSGCSYILGCSYSDTAKADFPRVFIYYRVFIFRYTTADFPRVFIYYRCSYILKGVHIYRVFIYYKMFMYITGCSYSDTAKADLPKKGQTS